MIMADLPEPAEKMQSPMINVGSGIAALRLGKGSCETTPSLTWRTRRQRSLPWRT